MKENFNPLTKVQSQIKNAVETLGLEDSVYEILKEPKSTLEVSIPLKRDDGSLEIFKGYRAIHNDAIGPGKGGTRFHPSVTLDEIKALSVWMTLKCSITGIPFGGAKGGIAIEPSQLSEAELERLSRTYIQMIHNNIGSKVDIPEPDVNTNSKIMAWFIDEYMNLTSSQDRGAITGKPISLGGSKGRDEATGFGVVKVLAKACSALDVNLKGAKVIIQGFGNVGSYAVRDLEKLGAKVIAIGEWAPSVGTYGIYNEDGLNYEELHNHFYVEGNRNFIDYPHGERISLEEFWKLNADIAIPAALENAITIEVAENLKAKIVCEAANGPTTSEADEILNARGITVIPDILANGGGVTTSYFEWVQNNQGMYWSAEQVLDTLQDYMERAFENIWNIGVQYDVTLREAAYIHAVKTVSGAMKDRGWY